MRKMAKNTGGGWTNRPWLLGVKLEGENWFEPVLNIHTLPSPTLTQFLLFARLQLSSTRTSWVENIRRNWLGGGGQMSPTSKSCDTGPICFRWIIDRAFGTRVTKYYSGRLRFSDLLQAGRFWVRTSAGSRSFSFFHRRPDWPLGPSGLLYSW